MVKTRESWKVKQQLWTRDVLEDKAKHDSVNADKRLREGRPAICSVSGIVTVVEIAAHLIGS